MSPRQIRPRRASVIVRAVVLLATMAAFVLLAVAPATAASGGVRMIETNNRYSFTPAKQFVTAGGSLTWTNTTDAPHTVTADSGSAVSSGQIAANKTFTMTFSTPGTIAYHCTVHPYMTGTIVVMAAGATLPPTDAVAASAATSVPASGLPGWIVAAVVLAGGLTGMLFVSRTRLGRHS